MTDNEYMMYEFKGRIMKELSRRLTKKVSINIFYKAETDFIGVILSTPENSDDCSRLYRIEDPWGKIQKNMSITADCAYIVDQYKGFICDKYFKRV